MHRDHLHLPILMRIRVLILWIHPRMDNKYADYKKFRVLKKKKGTVNTHKSSTLISSWHSPEPSTISKTENLSIFTTLESGGKTSCSRWRCGFPLVLPLCWICNVIFLIASCAAWRLPAVTVVFFGERWERWERWVVRAMEPEAVLYVEGCTTLLRSHTTLDY